jgi:hypothetical protein
MRWTVRVGESEAGPYEEGEVAELVRKGLRDALVRPDGGSWRHITTSPFAPLIPKPPSNAHTGWRIAALLVGALVLYILWRAFGAPVAVLIVR